MQRLRRDGAVMSFTSRAERDDWVQRFHAHEATFDACQVNYLASKQHSDTEEILYHEYADRLPRRIFSRCPITAQLFKSPIDPYGFDGPFWAAKKPFKIEQATPPSTYQVHLGAMQLRGRKSPEKGNFHIIPGPDVPFVIPALMQMTGMQAVISSFDLEVSVTCYIIAYFSETRFHLGELHSPWLKSEHWFTNDQGRQSWTICNDPWDFELAPYLRARTLHWIDPGAPTWTVRTVQSDPKECPYLDMPGIKRPQVIVRDHRGVQHLDLPDGSSTNPFQGE